MEVLEENSFVSEPLIVDQDIKGYLLEVAKWAKFLSIIGFVGLGLMIIGCLSFMMMSNSFSRMGGGASSMPMGLFGFIYLAIAFIYFFPILYLYKAALGMKTGINSDNQEVFKSGIENLKSHYKFIGIMMIVVLSIYVLMIGGVMIGAKL